VGLVCGRKGDIAMSKARRNIEIVPVWRKSVDRHLLLQALLALLAQFEEEAKEGQLNGTGEEVSHD